MVDVAEVLETDEGQNDSEVQPRERVAFLQDLSSHVDEDDIVPVLNMNKEEGTLHFLCTFCFRLR